MLFSNYSNYAVIIMELIMFRNKNIAEFVKANAMQRRLMVRCGFELETQSTGEPALDGEAYDNVVSARADELLNALPSWLPRRARENLTDMAYEVASEHIDMSDYYTSYDHEDIQNDIGNENIEVGSDNSVSGVEIRTVGGLKYFDFLQALKDTFSIDHVIDTKCSFHIHLSIPGVKHSHGASFQQALNEYLIEHQGKLPATVQERFRGAPKNSYIKKLVESREKYSFTFAHSQGTWEFRCFGNVQNVSEGMACLNLAIEALAYAYEVTQAGRKMITGNLSRDEVEELFIFALTENRSISTTKALLKLQKQKSA